MGYVTLIILSLTLSALIFGTLFGLGRGLNRSLLRLGLVFISIVVAILMRSAFVDLVMGIKIGDKTLEQSLVNMFGSSDSGLPESAQSVVFALVELIVGLVTFLLSFFALRFITWLIFYPILKIWIKQGENKRKGLGAIVGLVQGVMIAFSVLSPISGIFVQLNKLSQVQVDGQQIMNVPKELGLSEYISSPIGKVYNSGGGWIFDTITTKKDATGKKVSVSDACDVIVVVSGIAESFEELTKSVEVMTSETSTPTDRVEAMKTAGGKLVKIGGSLDDLSDGAKGMINGFIASIKDVVLEEGEEPTPEMEQIFSSFTVENLKLDSVGKALTGIGNYIEKTEEEFDCEETVTTQDAQDIVNGFADNIFLLHMLKTGDETPTLIDVEPQYEWMFQSALDETDLSAEDKEALRQLLGCNKAE